MFASGWPTKFNKPTQQKLIIKYFRDFDLLVIRQMVNEFYFNGRRKKC